VASVRLCKKYVEHKKLLKRLHLVYPDLNVKVKSCIGMCKFCETKPCLVFDGKKMKSTKISKLIESLTIKGKEV
jgi:hypothetical protein